MEIIEQQITPKSPKGETEDGIVVTDDFVAVIDGSTSKSSRRISPSVTNGRLCMLLICDYVRQADRNICLDDFCAGITAEVRKCYGSSLLYRLTEHPEERLTASCVIYSASKHEVWMIGDCQCLIGNKLFENPKPDEERIAQKRANEIKCMIETGEATVESLRRRDIARESILPDLIRSMEGQNKSYSVVDGFPIPVGKVRNIKVPYGASQIVLATDGYPHLLPTLAESEAALRKQLSEDPLNIETFKATKGFMEGNNSFDDRAYIRFLP